MKRPILLILAVMIAATAYGEDLQSDSRFDTKESLSKWCYEYHHHRDAESLVAAVTAMKKLEMLGHGHRETGDFMTGFLSAIFSEHPGRIAGWVDELGDLPFPGAAAIVMRAIAASDTDQAREALEEIASLSSPEAKLFINDLLKDPPGDFLTIPAKDPAVCNLLWGRYFATGDRRYVARIIGFLALAGKKKGLDKKAKTAESARDSLTVYAGQYPEVMTICEEELKRQPRKIRKKLKEIIAEAKGPDESGGE